MTLAELNKERMRRVQESPDSIMHINAWYAEQKRALLEHQYSTLHKEDFSDVQVVQFKPRFAYAGEAKDKSTFVITNTGALSW